MTDMYSKWRDFYAEKVRSWMSLEELRAECGKLTTTDGTSPELLLIHAMHALEEYVQRDEALLRQALEALLGQRGEPDWHTGKQRENAIAALSAALAEPTCKQSLQVAEQQGPEHISSPDCWCHPELDYKDPETGAEVWVHKELQ